MMRTWPFLVLLGLGTMMLGGVTHADPPTAPLTVPPAQARCFQVQFLLRLNGLEAQRFVQQVAGLRKMDPDDPAINTRISDLSRQAVMLRAEEAQAFTHVSQLLKTMGAPSSLRYWSEQTGDALQGPVTMDEDERKTATAQPDVANVLATLDECDRLETDTDAHITTFGAWLGLTYHAAGLWAADVGELSATLHIGLATGVPPRLSATLGHRLAATTPAGTPSPVKAALGLLSPQGGNLSDLAPLTTTDVPLATATQAQDALITAFSARPLTAQFPVSSP